MLMAAVVPRDTVVTYKPPRGTKVNLSTAHHVALADTGAVSPVKGEPVSEDDQSPTHASRGRLKSIQIHSPQLPPAAGSVTNHIITAELNHTSGSLYNLCHATNNGSVAQLARAAITRANSRRATLISQKSSTSTNVSVDKTEHPSRSPTSFSRTTSLCCDANDSRPNSIHSSTTTEEINLAIPLDEEERVEVEREAQSSQVLMLKSRSVTLTPEVVSQQPPLRDQHGLPRPLDLTPSSLQQRRSGLLLDQARRANYRANKNVSFDNTTRTEVYETELTESETDEREFVRLMSHWERRAHLRLPLTAENDYCPPGKEELGFLPKVLCFVLALVITGGILYGFNLVISHMNMNLFSA
nr:uncharacterized protein LOC123762549 [Procambarus clarkii]